MSDEIPINFEFCSPQKVLLYGFWDEKMRRNPLALRKRKNDLLPTLKNLRKCYEPGRMNLNLHFYYNKKEDAVLAVKLVNERKLHTESFSKLMGSRLHIFDALRKYLDDMDDNQGSCSRVVTIDDRINSEDRVLPQLYETGYEVIKMTPQQ